MEKKIFNGQKSVATSAEKICSITGKTYTGYGNNAYPFPGVCSDEANALYVIPARLMGITPQMVSKWGIETICRAITQKLNA